MELPSKSRYGKRRLRNSPSPSCLLHPIATEVLTPPAQDNPLPLWNVLARRARILRLSRGQGSSFDFECVDISPCQFHCFKYASKNSVLRQNNRAIIFTRMNRSFMMAMGSCSDKMVGEETSQIPYLPPPSVNCMFVTHI